MPLEAKDIPFFSPDIVELAAVFLTMLFSFIVMVALGKWWAR